MTRRRRSSSSTTDLVPPVLADDKLRYIEVLVAELDVDPSDLTNCLIQQPVLLQRAGRELARLVVAQEVAQREHRGRVATVDAQLRVVARQRGAEISEADLANQVRSEASVARAERAAADARRVAREAGFVYRAFCERGRVLLKLADLRIQGGE